MNIDMHDIVNNLTHTATQVESKQLSMITYHTYYIRMLASDSYSTLCIITVCNV